MPITGGLDRAVARAASIGATALQVFTHNQRQWTMPPLAAGAAPRFAAARRDWGGHPVAAHDSYLPNLANPDPEKRARSQAAFAAELVRAQTLDIPFLVTHPGAHLGAGAERGLALYARTLDAAIEASGTSAPRILLETTAGCGTTLGSTFAELARILETSRHPDRLGVCLDTCHAFAAGYDLATSAGFHATMAELRATVGADAVRFLHLNDSQHPLGSHKDRHEHIGQGHLGPNAFRNVLNHPDLAALPMTLETPKDETLAHDLRNLTTLAGLIE
jgi:deoxyribonuclease-4